jgi:hypothetical protein
LYSKLFCATLSASAIKHVNVHVRTIVGRISSGAAVIWIPMAGVALSLAIALGRRVVAHARDLGAVSEQWLTLHREAPSHGSR